jgi:hypothetical protein
MTSSTTPYVLSVTRDVADELADAVLRERAGVDSGVEIRTRALSRWDTAKIPAGARDEWGSVFAEVLNVGWNQLPPEGRLYLIDRD